MKQRTSNIKQHYVPQFYLRNFTDCKGLLKVYDVLRGHAYMSSPANECFEKYFYDLDTHIFELLSDLEENYEELVDDSIRILNEQVSSVLLRFLNQVKDSKDSFQFSREERHKLFDFIVLQMIRTPFYRSRLRYLNVPFCIKTGLTGELGDEKMEALIHNLLILGVLDRLHAKQFHFKKLYFTIFEHLLEEILYLRNQLENAGKLFLVNRSKDEFICSSTPINVLWKSNPSASVKALVTTFDDTKLFDIGEYLQFKTIHLPISSDAAIFLFDKDYSTALTAMNQGIGVIEDWNHDLLQNLNYSTMLKNGHKIYSSNANYDELVRLSKNRINPQMNFRF